MATCKKRYVEILAAEGGTAFFARNVSCHEDVVGSKDGYCPKHSGGSIYGGHRGNAVGFDEVGASTKSRIYWQLHRERVQGGLEVGRDGLTGQGDLTRAKLIRNIDDLVERGELLPKQRELILTADRG